jgi:hypothetical protein
MTQNVSWKTNEGSACQCGEILFRKVVHKVPSINGANAFTDGVVLHLRPENMLLAVTVSI